MNDRGKTVWLWTAVASLGAYLYWWAAIGTFLIIWARELSLTLGLWDFRQTIDVFRVVHRTYFATLMHRVTFLLLWLLSVLIVRIATRTAVPIKRWLVWMIRAPWFVLTPLVYFIVRLNHVTRTPWGTGESRVLNWPAGVLNIIVFLWMGWTLFAIGSSPGEEKNNG